MGATLSLVLLLALAAAPAAEPDREIAVLLPGMGGWHRPVTTSNAEAQRFFDQGLTLAFAFQHDEAIRSFERAAALDPALRLAWWGVALCHGPHINNPAMSPESSAAAWSALQKARASDGGASEVERALIEALAARYAASHLDDRAHLDRGYADAMAKLVARFPNDVDAAVLFAEALLDLHPWDTWRKNGTPQPWMKEIIATLERALAMAPHHPGANHLLIHALEASPAPQRAAAAADRLRTLVPGAGHLVHMAAHIDVRTGRWSDAVEANASAMRADAAYRALRKDLGFYGFYMVHNRHFLAYAAMMDGQAARALEAARGILDVLPAAFIEEHADGVDGFVAMPFETLLRFGRWDEILKEPEPEERLRISRALRHHARGVALAVKGDLSSARAELAALRGEAKLVGARMVGLNAGAQVVAIADQLLEGELAMLAGDTASGLAALRRAVALEDALAYDEPPPWVLPTRHVLGAALVTAKQGRAAERVYREDLKRNLDNGWALTGLARALRLQRREREALAVDARASQAFARADGPVTSSCPCLP